MLARERQCLAAASRIYKAGRKNSDSTISVAVLEMLKLGGLYVKFAQMLLLNQTFAKAIPHELRREVFDRVHVPKNASREMFFTPHDLAFLGQYLSHLSLAPSYAGSFAAVFDGLMKDGTAVVVKVLRPDIRKSVKQDLRLVELLARPLGLFNEEIRVALQGTMKLFRETTLRETDYKQEVFNAVQIAETFKDDTAVCIPKTYALLSTPRFIVQEKLAGVWLSELMELDLKGPMASDYVYRQVGSDLETQLYNLGVASLYHSLMGDPVHGDPHPGNIVLLQDDRVGLIDFGMIAHSVKNRLALLEYVKEQIRGKEGDVDIARLMLSILRFHANYLYRAVESLADFYQRPLLTELYNFLTQEVKTHSKGMDLSKIGSGEYSNMLAGSLNENNRFALMPKLDSPMTQKAFITLWRANDELGFLDTTFKIFKASTAMVENQQDVHAWQEAKMPLHQAYQIVVEWLSIVSEKDPALFDNLKRLLIPNKTAEVK